TSLSSFADEPGMPESCDVRTPRMEGIAMMKTVVARILGILTAPMVLALPGQVDAQTQTASERRAPAHEQPQMKMNAWTVGLAAGRIEGAPLRFAAEMARVVDDGANMLVLPIVTRGPTENLNSLLYLKGVDLAIINADALEEYRIGFPDIRLHI